MIVYITSRVAPPGRQRRCAAHTFPRGEGAERSEAEEEWRDVYLRIRYVKVLNRNFSARIPLQSPPEGGDSFPPGEAFCAAERRSATAGRRRFLLR